MERVAVVGAGFAGLAIAYRLRKAGFPVDLIDGNGIGGGASGVASGLLHPYPGEKVRRSRFADEAMAEAKELLAVAASVSKQEVADYSGIVRKVDPETEKVFKEHGERYGDVLAHEEGSVLIRSGIVVYSRKYLKGLFSVVADSGVQYIEKKITSLEELRSYDLFVLAAGAGTRFLLDPDHYSLRFMKGQGLICHPFSDVPFPKQAILGKGYIVPQDGVLHIGSTYERGCSDETVDPVRAVEDLTPKIQKLSGSKESLSVIECRAGVRVSHPFHYMPLIKKISSQGYMVTGFGSRGLLYHGYAAKLLVQSITEGDGWKEGYPF